MAFRLNSGVMLTYDIKCSLSRIKLEKKKTDHEIIDIVAISESLGFLMIYHITPIISFSDLEVSF